MPKGIGYGEASKLGVFSDWKKRRAAKKKKKEEEAKKKREKGLRDAGLTDRDIAKFYPKKKG